MPAYPWLIRNKHDRSNIQAKMRGLAKLGVPYIDEDIANAYKSIEEQASKIEKNLHNDPDFVKEYENSRLNAEKLGETFVPMKDREIVALIAYLQRLGTDIKIKTANAK